MISKEKFSIGICFQFLDHNDIIIQVSHCFHSDLCCGPLKTASWPPVKNHCSRATVSIRGYPYIMLAKKQLSEVFRYVKIDYRDDGTQSVLKVVEALTSFIEVEGAFKGVTTMHTYFKNLFLS